jgi:hypothetical protein
MLAGNAERRREQTLVQIIDALFVQTKTERTVASVEKLTNILADAEKAREEGRKGR